MSRKTLNHSALVQNVHRDGQAPVPALRLSAEGASPLSVDLQIPGASLIITSLLGAAARFRSDLSSFGCIFLSIASQLFI